MRWSQICSDRIMLIANLRLFPMATFRSSGWRTTSRCGAWRRASTRWLATAPNCGCDASRTPTPAPTCARRAASAASPGTSRRWSSRTNPRPVSHFGSFLRALALDLCTPRLPFGDKLQPRRAKSAAFSPSTTGASLCMNQPPADSTTRSRPQISSLEHR